MQSRVEPKSRSSSLRFPLLFSPKASNGFMPGIEGKGGEGGEGEGREGVEEGKDNREQGMEG